MIYDIRELFNQALFSNMTPLKVYIIWQVPEHSKSKQFQLQSLKILHKN